MIFINKSLEITGQSLKIAGHSLKILRRKYEITAYLCTSYFHMRRLGRNIGALLLLVLFTEFWCSTHLFYHSHIINGQVIVHSHPFQDQDAGTHSQQELKLISLLSAFISTSPDLALPELPVPPAVRCVLSYPQRDGHLRDFPVHLNGLRAPPSVMSSMS